MDDAQWVSKHTVAVMNTQFPRLLPVFGGWNFLGGFWSSCGVSFYCFLCQMYSCGFLWGLSFIFLQLCDFVWRIT
ncbi:hypothetical protein PHAVU_001G267700 [Phaseolus vulgaris]|uniref:Uncharacterized protein n=1 Tax=Phaseolus vulgaris TaxID=3885 RepID=V7D297_PHAVU|nr:hypothetical protein PHAVU_001G267700g [Phaseolus vulgaris]ESW35818.1 hypothetical protein PHAVU_001G267700g [Phaseolus vulgaris]